MGKIYPHPELENCMYWEFDPSTGWEGYSVELDELGNYARADSTEPFFLIFHPQGDVPKGNPVPHMRRIVQFSKTSPKVLQTAIIMGTDWFVAKAFASMLNRVMNLEPEVKLVFSLDEAVAAYHTCMEANANNRS